MIVECKCGNQIYLTHLTKDEYIHAYLKAQAQGETATRSQLRHILNNLWEIKKEKDFTCPKCRRKVEITEKNIVSFTVGDFQALGIKWTYFCLVCNSIVESMPYYYDKSVLQVCPNCNRSDNLIARYVPFYLGGSENIGLNTSMKCAKDFFFFVKSLLVVCCHKSEELGDEGHQLVDNLRLALIENALEDSKELNLLKVIENWKLIAESYNELHEKVEVSGIVSDEQLSRTEGEWREILTRMEHVGISEDEAPVASMNGDVAQMMAQMTRGATMSGTTKWTALLIRIRRWIGRVLR